YLFHGEDELTRSEELARWKTKLGDPALASLNTTILDGRKLDLSVLTRACETLPFMAERRVVIVENFWSKFEPPKESRGKEKRLRISATDAALIRELQQYLLKVPETTHLLFLESQALSQDNPAFHTLPTDKRRAYIKEFKPPMGDDLWRWIEQRMKNKGGAIMPQAAKELARLVGNELRQLDQELEKLVAYVNFQRPVTVTDVHKVASITLTGNIFALVDAIGLRQRERAIRCLHELLESGASPSYLLTMIERQFRILLQVKEMQAQRVAPSEMQTTLGISHAFIIEKSLRQTRNFTLERLEAILNRLAEVEQAIKTGQMDELLALDLLVVELCGG
ncbi:MAG: DNA polymerase III subunit delta, partial [Chloroflexi bacterium]|nr:DNA polymerase III subunit delta [Chloroflexota bacterium]